MDAKKGTVILVAIALLLAITAIVINVTSSESVSTVPSDLQVGPRAGEVGVTIQPTEGIEDRGPGDLA